MGESTTHKNYIDIIYKQTIKIIPKNHTKLVLMDGNDNLLVKEVPPLINRYRPDLFYEFGNILIIGEAKTKKDYNSKHSLSQYKEYLEYCNRYPGTAYLLFCCPWDCTLDLKRIVYKLLKKTELNVHLIFLDEIYGE
ncbi:MAG: hypothetical protein RR623_05965 [Bacilli bacterium]